MVDHTSLTLAINCLISFFGIIGNSVLILAFCLREHLRTPSNWLTVSSFVAGLIVACYYPFLGLVDTFIIKRNPLCFIILSIGLTSGLLFTLSIGAMTVERYISICYPLHAVRVITPRRIYIVIATFYAYSLMIPIVLPSVTPLGYLGDISASPHGCRAAAIFNFHYLGFILIQYLAPLPIMILANCRIFFILRRHFKVITHLPTIPHTSETVGSATAVNSGNVAVIADATRDRRLWKRELRSVTLLCALVIMYAFSFVPYVVYMQTVESGGTPFGYALTHSIAFTSASINPFLYGFGNKAFRGTILSIFCRRLTPRIEVLEA